MTGRVVVIGGGLAGITAALRCADAARQVTLFETKPLLGGLTHSFSRGALRVDNGQHVFLRCCTSYRALLDRLGVTDRVELQPRLAIPIRWPATQAPVWLRRSALPAPLHLAASLLQYRPLSRLERMRFALAAVALRRIDPTQPALVALLPRMRDAQVRDFFVTRERHATFRPAPGTAALRPPAVTASPGLFLASAWTATGWPATMEGAVRSGEAAATAVLTTTPTPTPLKTTTPTPTPLKTPTP